MSAAGVAAGAASVAALAVSIVSAMQLSRLSTSVSALEKGGPASVERKDDGAAALATERDALRGELSALKADLAALRSAAASTAQGTPEPSGDQWEKAVNAVLEKKELEAQERSAARYGSTRMNEAAKDVRQLTAALSLAGDQGRQVEEVLRAAFHRQGIAMASKLDPEMFRAELDRIREETTASVRELLTPEQAGKFDRMDKDWFPGPVANKPPRR